MMINLQTKTGFADIADAKIYYEGAGSGTLLVMIHAGVADSRQWDLEFDYFSNHFQVLRYDMRGYGKSDPVPGDFSHMSDLIALLEYLDIQEPMLIMGCSLGGGLAMDFALEHPSRVKALIMVCSAPSGLELDVPDSPKFSEAVKAFEAGDLDLVAEIETQIWFDGEGRSPKQVDQKMRKLLYEMDRLALGHEVKELGNRLPDSKNPAFDRLDELDIPVLVIVGSQDIPYMHAAADYMEEKLSKVQRKIIDDAAHLPNMDHPRRFQKMVEEFVGKIAE